MSDFNPAPALGLTEESSNEEIKKAAFQFVHEVGYMVFGTTAIDGKMPTARGLEVHYLDDEGNFYIGIAKGKPVYYELQKNPYLVGTIIRDTVKRLSASVRLNAHVTEIDPEEHPEIYAKYWELNPGTKALYRKDLDMFRIFILDSGETVNISRPYRQITRSYYARYATDRYDRDGAAQVKSKLGEGRSE